MPDMPIFMKDTIRLVKSKRAVNDPNFAIYKKLNDGQFIPFNKAAKDMEAERGNENNNMFDKKAQKQILEEEGYEILKDPDYI